MQIRGTFKDSDNNTVTVKIYNKDKTGSDINIDTSDWIRFDDDPVTITTECEDSFTHIIKKTCKITLISKRWMGDYLFANNATSIVVNVSRTVNGTTTCLFAGYVTPCTYNQDYANAWESIDINCIDNLGVLEYRQQTDEKSWAQLKAEAQLRTFKYLLTMMHLTDTDYNISNMPDVNSSSQTVWVETGYERITDPMTGEINYYVVETNVKELDSNTSVTTTNTQTGTTPMNVTYIQSEDIAFQDGIPYYKKYAYVSVNGELVNTGDWILGDVADDIMPTVVDTVNVLDGWSYGPIPQPFEYYEHFRIDNVMSDGSIKTGQSDTIGDRIPETPSATTLGSYYEFRQGDEDDLYDPDDDPLTDTLYYKNYAWIIMEINNRSYQFKTGDWVQGARYIPTQEEIQSGN